MKIMKEKVNLSNEELSKIGVTYKIINNVRVKTFNLEERVKYINKNQFWPLFGFYQASIDVLKDRPSVLREFAGTSPSKYLGWCAYQALSAFITIGIAHDYLHINLLPFLIK